MIIGIGCDIVEHDLTKLLGWETDSNFLSKVFSQRELEIYHSEESIRFISGRFAAKEAVLKCLGTGIYDGISLAHIQILRSPDGKPTIELFGLVNQICTGMEINKWHITISHSRTYSTAFAIAERL